MKGPNWLGRAADSAAEGVGGYAARRVGPGVAFLWAFLSFMAFVASLATLGTLMGVLVVPVLAWRIYRFGTALDQAANNEKAIYRLFVCGCTAFLFYTLLQLWPAYQCDVSGPGRYSALIIEFDCLPLEPAWQTLSYARLRGALLYVICAAVFLAGSIAALRNAK